MTRSEMIEKISELQQWVPGETHSTIQVKELRALYGKWFEEDIENICLGDLFISFCAGVPPVGREGRVRKNEDVDWGRVSSGWMVAVASCQNKLNKGELE